MISVLVVEDSAVARELLIHILRSDPGIEVCGWARNGEEAIAAIAERKPDVITMDIHMPGMDGFETTRRIMETKPVPIVIVSASYEPENVAMTFRAMEAGALAAVEKPPGMDDPTFATLARKLVNTVKSMSEVRVIRRWPRPTNAARPAERVPVRVEPPRAAAGIQLIAIGASTGGPPVLQTILAALRKPLPVPVVIVQHISAGFVQGLADWLSGSTGVTVQIATNGERLVAGRAYLAPDGCQLRVDRGLRAICSSAVPENGLRPAVSFLFRSVAQTFGDAAVGVLLTGMGRDGADELKLMRDAGAITFAQDQASSVVYGMPGEAVRIHGATYVLPPVGIAGAIDTLLAVKKDHPPRP